MLNMMGSVITGMHPVILQGHILAIRGWKIGVDGLASWTYPGARTVQWEIVREGIDDLKYLKLIERLIHGKNITPKPLKSAEAFLDEVMLDLGCCSAHFSSRTETLDLPRL